MTETGAPATITDKVVASFEAQAAEYDGNADTARWLGMHDDAAYWAHRADQERAMAAFHRAKG